jgi:hypothetical protein
MELKHDLSQCLQEALDKRLTPGEKVVVSLPGSFGEAFVVSDKQVFVIREHASGPEPGCDVFAYPIASVSGAKALATGTGGYVEIDVPEAKADPEKGRVYFPAYDIDTFKAAADMVNASIASRASAAPAEAAAPSGANLCPKCGAPDPTLPYCRECGELLATICANCASVSPRGAKFCVACGKSMIEFNPQCPTCGTRISRWQAFCTDCGSVLQITCATCAASVLPTFKHCAHCGRGIGADRLDPRLSAAAQRRIADIQASQAPAEPAEEASDTTPPVFTALSEAEDHNKRGQELYGAEDVTAAIREFREAVRLEPGNGSYHCNLAIALDDNGDDEEALAEYERCLELDPNDLTALLSLGCMYNENERPEQAAEAWNKIISIAPLSAEAQEARDNLKHQQEL